MKKWCILILAVVLLGVVGCSSSDSQKGSQQATQSSADTTQEQATTARETTREKTAKEKTAREKTTARAEKTTTQSSAPDEEGITASSYDATARVTKVVDGDTVDVTPAIDGITRVRLIGVDTPETKEPGCQPQPYGEEASDFTTAQLQGKEVGLEFDQDKADQYDRLLAYVYKSDEDMFNEDLLEGGYAQVATFPPNVKYVERFLAAQERARATGLGIWSLSPEELAKLEDRGNGIGGGGCAEEGIQTSSAQPQPEPKSSPKPRPQPQPTPQPQPQALPEPEQKAAPAGRDVDCSDFSSSAEAQRYLLPGDPYKLDRDGDGQACDNLR